MHPYRYRVALQLQHPQADLRELGSYLHAAPSRSWQAGDPRVTPKGTVLPGLRQDSSWSADLTPGEHPADSREEDLEAFIERQLDRLSPHAGRLQALNADGGRAGFFIGLFCGDNSGFVLSPALMAKAAALGVELGFDLYPPEPPSAAAS
ncbi:DUF4279 domain-containing protein [Lysobacter sp. Hz 25]|uniref:DUF4279 domain-containing protein n=1 Tax=Lysobacter sp. Hz 25 TaxID=3383698 RepID=UPI0038D4F39E